jgi:hypothetical protein
MSTAPLSKPSKPSNVRLEECVQIRARLQSVGALLEDRNQEVTKSSMNDFVRSTESKKTTFHLPLRGTGIDVRVELMGDPGSQSGVTMIKTK